MMLAETTQPFVEAIVNQISSWVFLDVAVILTITVLLIVRDLSIQNRPFDPIPIILSSPFVILVMIQSMIVAVALANSRRPGSGDVELWF